MMSVVCVQYPLSSSCVGRYYRTRIIVPLSRTASLVRGMNVNFLAPPVWYVFVGGAEVERRVQGVRAAF